MKININTLIGNENYGNKLQHYALQESLKKYSDIVDSTYFYYTKKKIMFKIKRIIKEIVNKRIRIFKKFDRYIKYSNNYSYNEKLIKKNEYYFYIAGSDQIWNTTIGSFSKQYLLYDVIPNKRIAYAASFGTDKISDEYKELFKQELNKFKAISVREDRGKEIIEELTGRKDVEVLVDPTMLLTAEEWDKVSKKPEQLNTDRYILNYFLGDLSEERRKEIERIAKENNCEIINIMDKNDPLYVSGPSEFLWLEKHAFLICTDSFHSSVFALLYNRPFIVFDREQDGLENMNSRIDTLINKFNLKNRRFTGKIIDENLKHDYTEAYEILEKEREKSRKFLEKALDIENKE